MFCIYWSPFIPIIADIDATLDLVNISQEIHSVLNFLSGNWPEKVTHQLPSPAAADGSGAATQSTLLSAFSWLKSN